MTNPCGEIILLGNPQPVMPWVQAQMMNSIRVGQGLPPYTAEEINKIISDLENYKKSPYRDIEEPFEPQIH